MEETQVVQVAVAGKFDPPHDGHICHILKAAKLGDSLVIITHPDYVIRRVKGKCNIPLWARSAMLTGILMVFNIKGKVVVSVDADGSVSRTLSMVRPQIYAKGGDRTLDNMNQAEVEACRMIGCEIRYGVGDQLNRSSEMIL